MKIVIPGGSGHIGRIVSRAYVERGHEVVILRRTNGATPDDAVPGVRTVGWDGKTLGSWAEEIDGADAVLNLAGRSVSCRYTADNMRDMMDSRVESTEVVGAAIGAATTPPPVWLQMSTATIYAHAAATPDPASRDRPSDGPHDEADGVFGGDEPGVPGYWKYSVEIAKAWERAQDEAPTPHTRKVALRTAMVMSTEPGGVLEVLLRMVAFRLGGPVAGGTQFVSWLHDADLIRAIDFLLDRDDVTGPVNLSSPDPLPQREFMRLLRAARGVRVGLPAMAWMARIGALVLRSDSELLLKSRRVVPGRLTELGFEFEFANWRDAASDLVRRSQRES